MRACLFALPEDVERFEPVLRRCCGAEALLSPGRYLPARRDSRVLVRDALRQRGWLPRERAERGFDRILTTTRVAPSQVAAWLAPGGRVVLWHDPAVASRWDLGIATRRAQPEIAAIVAPTPEALDGVHPEHATAVGDPLLDASFEAGAAARARAALRTSGERPVVLVVIDAMPDPQWASSIAALRTEADVILLLADPVALGDPANAWPRALTGPGLYAVGPAGPCRRADVLALADLVVGIDGAIVRGAALRGRRALVLESAARSRTRGSAAELPSVVAPGDLREAVVDALADGAPEARTTDDAAGRLADVLDARALDLAAL